MVGPETAEDARLIAGVRTGSAACANELVKRCGPRVKACVHRLLRQRATEHDDLVQLALVELVTSIDRFRGQCSLDTWIDRLTTHVVYKRLRRMKLERRIFDGLAEDALSVASSASTERPSLAANLLERVKERLAGVSEDKVSAWVLFEVHGMSLEELAEMMGVTLAAAQSRVSRARREVRERLDSDPELVAALASIGGAA